DAVGVAIADVVSTVALTIGRVIVVGEVIHIGTAHALTIFDDRGFIRFEGEEPLTHGFALTVHIGIPHGYGHVAGGYHIFGTIMQIIGGTINREAVLVALTDGAELQAGGRAGVIHAGGIEGGTLEIPAIDGITIRLYEDEGGIAAAGVRVDA